MSLFSTIQIAKNSLVAAQMGLQVTSNNVANANTPGYIRQNLVLTPAPTQRYGGLLLGLGVSVQAVVQQTDRFLEERVRNAASDLANSQAQEDTYVQLESLIGELSDTDLSTGLSEFFNSIHDILNQPDSASVRNLAVLQGKTLTDDIRRLDTRVREVRDNVNDQIGAAADEINRLLKEVSTLNVQISIAEGGGAVASDAVGLRDKRSQVLTQLSSIIDIQAVEQTSGDVTVFSGGDYLVFQGTFRPVTTVTKSDRDLNSYEIRLAETDSPINTSSGSLAGLISSRDNILGGFLDQLDTFTQNLMFEFNKLHSSGQGLTGLSEATSEFAVNNTAAALDQAGLTFNPVNGSFEVLVRNQQTGLTTTTQVRVDLNGLDGDTTLDELAAAINNIDGISAIVTPNRKLEIKGDSQLVTFSFANDTSGALAALGVNTFFTGSGASSIGINKTVQTDPSKFAASGGGIGEDTAIAVKLANLLNAPLASLGGSNLAVQYDRFVGEVTQGASVTKSVAEGFRVFHGTLEGQLLAVQGVNIDEEAIKMIAYQRAFQASARVVSTISELLETLVNL
ncbi:Flagellar hook-associated protein 1 [Anatilimnocola aggregata]|uniref:Flagellar hook-associated protein 1 n=1 Tax=Anatilimnocola aggregata TaxID=2528021 RepID=A0A517YKW3_9BACT|nr:flagellar hook-associated protein FlgK [Anatilimnocola aggregata]QDU30848.1 Flagellar hook-associated protein 1 [Anatilimnocola aggregata]